MTREELYEELRRIEGSDYDVRFSLKERRRVEEICKILSECICRNCKKHYDSRKARGEYKGFCSAKCQHEKARELGFRRSSTRREYEVLKNAKCIGDIFVLKPEKPNAHP